MAVVRLMCVCLFVAGLSGCGASSQERMDEADAKMQEEKLLILQDYRKCLQKYQGKEDAEENCEPLRQAAEAFHK